MKMKDMTPAFVEDNGTVQNGGLHCQLVTCVADHASLAASHAAVHTTYAAHFLAWLFG